MFERVLSAAALAFFLGVSATAQTHLAIIRGTVSDATGARIENADITVVDQSTALARTATTDGRGRFAVSQRPPKPQNLMPRAFSMQI